jgi:cytochrome c
VILLKILKNINMKKSSFSRSNLFNAFGIIFLFFFAACSGGSNNSTSTDNSQAQSTDNNTTSAPDWKQDKGIGPVTEDIQLGAINSDIADSGKKLFVAKCSACHKMEAKYVGPALNGVTGRQRPEWIMNMILNPGEMTQKDYFAKDLLAQLSTQMTNQNVSKDQARQILEYFRQYDATNRGTTK